MAPPQASPLPLPLSRAGIPIITGKSQFSIRRGANEVVRSYQNVAMLAGGSGLTPMLQIIRAVSEDPRDLTNVHLIFANQEGGRGCLILFCACARARSFIQSWIAPDTGLDGARGAVPPIHLVRI